MTYSSKKWKLWSLKKTLEATVIAKLPLLLRGSKSGFSIPGIGLSQETILTQRKDD